MTKPFTYRVGVPESDATRRAFLQACVKAKRCMKCRGPVRLVNKGASIDIDHRDGCPELQRVATEQVPETFRSHP